jgi:hypothetical protein
MTGSPQSVSRCFEGLPALVLVRFLFEFLVPWRAFQNGRALFLPRLWVDTFFIHERGIKLLSFFLAGSSMLSSGLILIECPSVPAILRLDFMEAAYLHSNRFVRYLYSVAESHLEVQTFKRHILSRRGDAIVAWHEVPGKAPLERTVP